MNSATDSLDEFGKSEAYISLIFTIVIAIILFIGAMYYFADSDDTDYIATTGTIIDSSCTSRDPDNGLYDCDITVRYLYGGVYMNAELPVSANKPYKKMDKIKISINRTNPNDITINSESDSSISSILCVAGIVLLLFGFGNYFMANNSKLYSEMQGSDTVGEIARLF